MNIVRETMSSTVAVVEQALNTFKRSLTYIDTGMQTTLDIAQDLIDNETGISELTFEELTNIMKDYVELQEDSRQFAEAAQNVKDQFLSTNTINIEEDLDRLLVDLARPNRKVDLQNHSKYKALVNKIKDYQDASGNSELQNDDDVVMTQPIIVTIDPISKQEMKDPVKNTICGHSYDRHTIMQYITNKKKARCPFVGCGNNNVLKVADLEDNVRLKHQIESKNFSES